MGKVLKRTNGDLGINSKSRTNGIKIIQMIIGAIVFGMLIGYGIGQYIVDRYINEGNEEVNEQNHTKK